MTIFLIILIILLAVIAIPLILALFMKKEHYVKREIQIDVPNQVAFDFLKLLKNQDKFNKWAKNDPNRKWEYHGTDGTIGFVISWNGDKSAGEGEKEITNIVDGERIETQIRFVRPMKMVADVIMETEKVSETSTKVSLINSGTMKYPLNLFIPMAEKKFPKDMDESLVTLKYLLELNPNSDK